MTHAGRGRQTAVHDASGAAVLCYHSVHPDGPPYLSVPPDTFERQLARLRRSGYRTAGLEALDALDRGERPSTRQALLTFDDGFLDNYTHAFPLLRAYGAVALIFLLRPAVDAGGPLIWPEVAERAERHPAVFRSVTWPMVEEMAAGDVQFGSHTLAHHRLTSLGDEALTQELLDSRRRIAARLGRCDALAYPFGGWDGRVAAGAVAAGSPCPGMRSAAPRRCRYRGSPSTSATTSAGSRSSSRPRVADCCSPRPRRTCAGRGRCSRIGGGRATTGERTSP